MNVIKLLEISREAGAISVRLNRIFRRKQHRTDIERIGGLCIEDCSFFKQDVGFEIVRKQAQLVYDCEWTHIFPSIPVRIAAGEYNLAEKLSELFKNIAEEIEEIAAIKSEERD